LPHSAPGVGLGVRLGVGVGVGVDVGLEVGVGLGLSDWAKTTRETGGEIKILLNKIEQANIIMEKIEIFKISFCIILIFIYLKDIKDK
jgi:hypothetical protein